MEELLVLLRELHDMGIIPGESLQEWTLLVPDDERAVRIRIFGCIDASVHGNEITAEQAEPYIQRLGISPEDMTKMRSSHHDERADKKRLN